MLVALRPTNMDQEREKFFQSHYTYNPQFEYQEPMPMSVLEKYQEASAQFMNQLASLRLSWRSLALMKTLRLPQGASC